MIRVVICDDQKIVSDGLHVILDSYPDIEVVGIANDGEQALALVREKHPDIVLMDLKMPIMNGIRATQLIHQQFPEIQVLVLTTFDADEWVFDAIRAGATGYLLKDTQRNDLVKAIRDTIEGKSHIDPAVAGKVLDRVANTTVRQPDSSRLNTLSERELDVLRLIAQGMSNAEISGHLHISKGTVGNYVSGILAKLEVVDRTQAAILAWRHGLVDLNETISGPPK